MKRRLALFFALPAAVMLALTAAGCGGGDNNSLGGGGGDTKLTLVAYSTPREAYEEIIPAFEETPDGDGRRLRAVLRRPPASRAARSRRVSPPTSSPSRSSRTSRASSTQASSTPTGRRTSTRAWSPTPSSSSSSARATQRTSRPGTTSSRRASRSSRRTRSPRAAPSGTSWPPTARSSSRGKSEEEGIEYLRDLFLEHVPVQDKSARESLQTFAAGKGDVLLAYENEAIFAQEAGQPIEYVVPDETILIENPVAVTSTSRTPRRRRRSSTTCATPEAQRIFGEKGYRPVERGGAGRVRLPRAVRASSRSPTSAAGPT